MPFNDTSAFLGSKSDYVTALKAEIKKLKPGVLGDFYFYDGIPVDGNDEAIVLLGKVKDKVAKELRSQAKVKGVGTCFLEGSTIKITLTAGKAPETKLKDVFRATKNYGFKMVEADMSPVKKEEIDPSETDGMTPDEIRAYKLQKQKEHDLRKVQARFIKAEDDYKRVKDRFDTSSTTTIDTLIGRIDTAIRATDPNLKAVIKAIMGLEKALANLIKSNPDPTAADAEKEKVKKDFQKLQAKAKKITQALPQTDKDAIEVLTAEFAVLFKAKSWPECAVKIKEIDSELVRRAKLALAAQKSDATTKTETIEQSVDSDPAAVLLRTELESQDTILNAQLKTMSEHMAALEKQREALRIEKAKSPPDPTVLGQIQTEVDAAKRRVADARTVADEERKKLNAIAKRLADLKAGASSSLVNEVKEANAKIKSLETMLDDPSMQQAQSELSDTIKSMAEATEWREERLKEEATSRQHGTGRHGAQTGLERQARRAATTEMQTQPNGKKKAASGTGITPDQADNVAGTAKREVWNQVEIEYTEEDGRRVIKNRNKVAQAIAAVPSRTQGSDTGSMWATPVLEKEAFDLANKVATALKDFPQYKKSSGYGDFKKLVVVLPPPKSAPGWGYAVKKLSDAPVAPGDAEAILERFEQGKISLDKLFDEMNVKLLVDGDGRNMVRHATCVFSRNGTGDDFKMVTQYPNDQKGTGDVGWEPYPNAPGTMRFKKNGHAKQWEADLSSIPVSISATTTDV